MKRELCSATQVVTAVPLRHVRSGLTVLACSCHVLSSYMSPHIQYLQVVVMLAGLHELWSASRTDSIVLCGDFNTTPTDAAYDYITRGWVKRSHRVFEVAAQAECVLPDVPPAPFVMKSSFKSCAGQEPPFSLYTPGFHGCLDYIFFATRDEQRGAFEPVATLGMPSEVFVASHVGMPSEMYPSDHLSLVTCFRTHAK